VLLGALVTLGRDEIEGASVSPKPLGKSDGETDKEGIFDDDGV